MSDRNSLNQAIIAEFRANDGKVGGDFAQVPLLLLNTIGAKSGEPRTNPMAYTTDGGRMVVIASNGGRPTHPGWYHNVLANPLVSVEVGREQFQARATVADEQERDRLYALMVEHLPFFAGYQEKTTRKIPVVILERLG